MFNRKKTINNDKVNLLKSGIVSSDLFSIFGSQVRETRLSAILGYIIAHKPEYFTNKLDIKGKIQNVSLEYYFDDKKRIDILIETEDVYLIIETKVTEVDPIDQIYSYRERLRNKNKKIMGLCIVPYISYKDKYQWIKIRDWEFIHAILNEIRNTGRIKGILKYLIEEVIIYMDRHNLIKTVNSKEIKEIYAREINTWYNFDLLFKLQIYQCPYEKQDRINNTLYFAPCFAKKIVKQHPTVYAGISYIAKIEERVRIDSRKEFIKEYIKHRGQASYNKNIDILKKILNEIFKDKHHTYKLLLFLSEPKLLFNPSVKKNLLQKDPGFLNQNYWGLDELITKSHIGKTDWGKKST